MEKIRVCILALSNDDGSFLVDIRESHNMSRCIDSMYIATSNRDETNVVKDGAYLLKVLSTYKWDNYIIDDILINFKYDDFEKEVI